VFFYQNSGGVISKIDKKLTKLLEKAPPFLDLTMK
jgi:hypothetical protein